MHLFGLILDESLWFAVENILGFYIYVFAFTQFRPDVAEREESFVVFFFLPLLSSFCDNKWLKGNDAFAKTLYFKVNTIIAGLVL